MTTDRLQWKRFGFKVFIHIPVIFQVCDNENIFSDVQKHRGMPPVYLFERNYLKRYSWLQNKFKFKQNQEWIGKLNILLYFVFYHQVPNIGERIYGTSEGTYYETSGCKSQLSH